MNIIYLHGFQSSENSIKGQLLKQYTAGYSNISVHLPNLNKPPQQVMAEMSALIESLNKVVLVGSSLGGFYATQLMAQYQLPTVLINPAIRPWQLFRDLFQHVRLPYQVTKTWRLDDAQLDDMQSLAVQQIPHPKLLLVLLQQGDETLDYREAQQFYSAEEAGMALVMTDVGGSHGMDDFAEKIPMVLQFLADAVKNMQSLSSNYQKNSEIGSCDII
ncbi:esterase [Acinetobacter sp. ANC 5054]|uniref:YqiA/YcfP family alpha/beta fold hydrolase n=1 Tax=Acinetobacter sp. ANC 5054 TaxID=1977877 RepID=UPI000A35BA69|nr:YqiA/YcfP family alpha/beta fold hydrolase [Acinetobacter sp. ANC 5054]OTG84559.1 esterase [Acinetobacter sp. ANC 5054]